MIRDTSLMAYKEISEEGKIDTQRIEIIRILNKFKALTREEIHKLTGLMYSSVCGRVRELMIEGLVYEEGIKINLSGKKARIIRRL